MRSAGLIASDAVLPFHEIHVIFKGGGNSVLALHINELRRKRVK